MIDLVFALGQFACVVGLLYWVLLTFARWREAGDFRGDFDPLFAYPADALVEVLVNPYTEALRSAGLRNTL